jgi:thiosulfate reductase cytochrome b subunit
MSAITRRPARVAFLVALTLTSAGKPAPAAAQVASEARIHPTIPLLDARGENVLRTGNPVSPRTTCGDCHDVDYIQAHTLHDPTAMGVLSTPAQVVSSRPRTVEARGEEEMNCFLCHTPEPDHLARTETLRGNRPDWAAAATLANTSIVLPQGGRWRWNPDAFDSQGRVLDSLLALQGPTTGNCAQCHGIAGDDMDEPVVLKGLGPGDLQTVTRGEIISPQRISESGVNLVGKSSLNRSWDIHAERLLECANCHYAENNPIYRKESEATQPKGLIFDSRRMPLGAYLQRPSHNFAGQSTGNGQTQPSGSLSCESCHDPAPTHQWLPYAKRHTDALACEVCHSPTLYSVAVESVDWSTVDADLNPNVNWRGCEAGCETGATDLVRGVEPALLLRKEEDGRTRLAPYNLVTSWYWVGGAESTAVDLGMVRKASAGASGVEEVRSTLEAMGVEAPRLKGEIQPYAIHHTVTGGEWATRECSTCHDEDSRLSRTVVLSESPPSSEIPTLVADAEVEWAGSVHRQESGVLVYRPAPGAAGLYILGHDFVWWSNLLGILAVVGTLLGILIHGGLRWRSGHAQPAGALAETPPVYMYSTYERTWHWLQALAILLLLVTGIEIHVTRVGFMDFALAVSIHNIVGFVVLANAIFAAFYHVASGEIQHYLPRPEGFFNAAITQSRFYLAGIFRGDAHPFEKTPGRKLNPLQQVTYLGILNVLLPLQVVTGVLIWGAQRWPVVDGWLGGLDFLAPLHAFGAWIFAAFLLMHVYLTTTGPSPLANLRAMAIGWEGMETVEKEVEAL